MQKNSNHTFIVLAYKQSPHLEDCLISLLNQTRKSNIIIATSTPSEFLESICSKYNLPLKVNHQTKNTIASDWTFAYNIADSQFVTLAHQDDIYCTTFVENLLNYKNEFLISFTNYYEIKNKDDIIKTNLNLLIKRMLLIPFYFKKNISNSFIKKFILMFGSPICCPSVTYNKTKIKNLVFNNNFSINMDWDTWLNLVKQKGSFQYIKKAVVHHRIHADSETSNGLQENKRQSEDEIIFQRLWGKSFGLLLAKIYSLSYKSNK